MAWTAGTSIGGGSNKVADNNAAFSPSSAITAGTVLVLQCAADNAAAVAGATNDHVVFDSVGNTYTKLDEWTFDAGGAGTGVTVSVWACQLTTPLAITDTITLQVPSGVTAKAIGGFTYTLPAGHTWSLTTRTHRTDAAATAPTALQLTGLASREYLFIGCNAIDAPTTDTYSVSAGYSAAANRGTSGGVANTNVWGHQARNISTGTSSPAYQPSDSTGAVNWAVTLIALQESTGASLGVTSTGATISDSVNSTVTGGGAGGTGGTATPTPIKRVSGRVGCSEYQLYVYPRGLGTQMIGSLDSPGWTALAWEWREGDKSQCTVTLANLANNPSCLATFARTRKWQHELVVIRVDDGRIWSGPITGRTTSGGNGTITAYSLDVWLERRDLLQSYPQPTNTNKPPHAYELADSYAQRWHDAIDRQNDMGYQLVVTGDTGILLALEGTSSRDHAIMHDTVQPLLDAGLEQVTIDRTTTIGPPSGLLLPRQLLDEHTFMLPDVTEDGLAQANRNGVFAQANQSAGGNQPPPYAEAVDTSLILRDGELYLSEQSSSALTAADAQIIADQRQLVYADLQPQIASVILTQDAPFPLPQLVPGRLIDTRLRQQPIPVDGLYRITRVGGTVDTQNGEQITVELAYAPDAEVTGIAPAG